MQIENLPSCLDENSIRVEGTGESASIVDVIHIPPPPPQDWTERVDKEVAEDYTRLEKEYKRLRNEKSTLEGTLKILNDFARTLKADEVSPSVLTNFMDTIARRRRGVYKSVKEVEERSKKVMKEMERHKDHVSDESLKRKAGVTVIVESGEDGPAELIISYGMSLPVLYPDG